MIDDSHKCCPECFAAEMVQARIEESGALGHCDFCGSDDVLVVEPSTLEDLFEPLLQYYEVIAYGVHYLGEADPLDYGENLGHLLQQDWGIFSDRLDGSEAVNDLIEAITGVDAHDLWATEEDRWYVEPGTAGDSWRRLADHVKRDRRFFLDTRRSGVEAPRDWLSLFLEEVGRPLRRGEHVWRSRLRGDSDEEGRVVPYPRSRMGAPPPDPQRSGRGNPPGIAYLYVATDMATAVGEKRPGAGTVLSVAKLRVRRDLELVDLAAVVPPESPFGHESIAHAIRAYQILSSLGHELSKPVHHDDPITEYIPSQFLCELILDLGYDGVVYGSGYGPGKNVLLFDPEAATPVCVQLVRVNSLALDLEVGTTYEPQDSSLY